MNQIFGERGEIRFSDDCNKVQCHICGRYFRNLCSSHVPRKHHMTAQEYKKQFGLNNTIGLVGQETSQISAIVHSEHLTGIPPRRGGKLSSEPKRLQARKAISQKRRGIINAGHQRISMRSKERYELMTFLRSAGLTYEALKEVFGFKNVTAAIKKVSKLKRRFIGGLSRDQVNGPRNQKL